MGDLLFHFLQSMKRRENLDSIAIRSEGMLILSKIMTHGVFAAPRAHAVFLDVTSRVSQRISPHNAPSEYYHDHVCNHRRNISVIPPVITLHVVLMLKQARY